MEVIRTYEKLFVLTLIFAFFYLKHLDWILEIYSEGLASRMMALMEDEGLRQRMGHESVQVDERFEADVIAGEWKRLYERLMDK